MAPHYWRLGLPRGFHLFKFGAEVAAGVARPPVKITCHQSWRVRRQAQLRLIDSGLSKLSVMSVLGTLSIIGRFPSDDFDLAINCLDSPLLFLLLPSNIRAGN